MFNKLNIILLFIIGTTNFIYATDVPESETSGAQAKTAEQAEQILFAKTTEYEQEKPSKNIHSGKEQQGGPEIFIKKIEIIGVQTIDFKQAQDVVVEYENSSMTFADLNKVANQITKLYQRQGFLSSYAYLPVQEVKDGVVKIKVVEAKVGKIKVENNKYFSDKVLSRDLEHRLQSNVFDYEMLSYVIGQLNINPDRDIKAYLIPGDIEKETDILLKVDDKRPGHFELDVNNTGTDATGKQRYGTGFTTSNLLGLDDSWTIKYIYGDGFDGIASAYTVPIYDNRTKLGFSYQTVDVDVGGNYKHLEVKGYSHVWNVFISRELFHQRNLDAKWNLGFSGKRIKNEMLGVTTGVDDLSVIEYEVSLDFKDKYGRTFITQGFDFGVPNLLGSSVKGDIGMNRAGSEAAFIKYRGSFDRYHRLTLIDRAILHLRSRYQYSKDNLSSSEQFSLGGFNNVRGYSEGEYLGDIGLILGAEVFFRLTDSLQLVSFYDFGYAKLNKPGAGQHEDKIFKGFGAGLRLHLFKDTYARLEWGFPCGDENTSGDSEFHFFVQTEVG